MLIYSFFLPAARLAATLRSELSFSNARNLSGGSQVSRGESAGLVVERPQPAELAALDLEDVEDRAVNLDAARLALPHPMHSHDQQVVALSDHILKRRGERLPAPAERRPQLADLVVAAVDLLVGRKIWQAKCDVPLDVFVDVRHGLVERSTAEGIQPAPDEGDVLGVASGFAQRRRPSSPTSVRYRSMSERSR